MIPYSLLAVTLILAIISMVVLWRTPIWHRLLLALSLAAFDYLFGAWLFISIYLKYVFAAAFLLLLLIRIISAKSPSEKKPNSGKLILNLILSVILITLNILFFTGTTGKPFGIARLHLPFRSGRFIVFQGGKGLPTNVFHYGLRGAVYAMDLAKLNKYGNRANHIFSTRLDDYEIFSDTILSPCNGIIAHTTDINPDNIPPSRKRGPTNTNQVLIATDSMYVFLAHMRYHKVFVKQGDTVITGQPLGLVGNSGFSLEPHLHIQVHARTNTGLPWYKEKPLLIEFDDKSYLLFDVISVP